MYILVGKSVQEIKKIQLELYKLHRPKKEKKIDTMTKRVRQRDNDKERQTEREGERQRYRERQRQ